MVYFDKSDSELESNEDGHEASNNGSAKKKANTEPDLLHLSETSESAQLYTSHALASVTNSLPQKKKSWSSQRQWCGKENWVSNVKMGSKAATALTFEREVLCSSLHNDEAKMHASPKKRSSKKKANAIDSDSDEFKLSPDTDDEDESIPANTVPESRSLKKKANAMDSRRQRPFSPSREKCPAHHRPWTRTTRMSLNMA